MKHKYKKQNLQREPMKKLTFKEYLESKETLRKAITESPIHTVSYAVKKYCKLPVGEGDDRITVALKPKQKIIIEWKYEDINNPDILSIVFSDEVEQYVPSWSNTKMKNWLKTNTRED